MTASALVRPLPPSFASTRDALHQLACYVLAPARKAQTGHIELRPDGTGFGTSALPDGRTIAVRGDQIVVEPGASAPITTLRAAAASVGVALSADPGVGRDLPPFRPDDVLAVDVESSLILGNWYRFGQELLEPLAAEGAGAVLWPEHFDLAVVVSSPAGWTANIGCSPGDADEPEPYVYVGPHDRRGLTDAYWNAPFGALLRHRDLLASGDPAAEASAFIDQGRALLGP